MKLIISALFIATIHMFAQEPSVARLEDRPELLSITTTMPKSPATLTTGEKLSVTIRYTNPTTDSVRIFARPYTNGKRTPGYGAHPSAAYPKGPGQVEGWFSFSSATTVDEIQVEMIDSKTQELIAAVKLPVQLTWKRLPSATAGTPNRAAEIGNAGFLAVGSNYYLTFAENARALPRLVPNEPVKIIAAAPGGWYRVEFSTRATAKPDATQPAPLQKQQTWINFAYVIRADEFTPAPEAKQQ